MSKFKKTHGPSTKNVTWAEDDHSGSSKGSQDRPSSASFSASLVTPISGAFTLVKRINSWFHNTAQSAQVPATPSQTLPVSKDLPTADDLEAMTVSELIDNLEYRSRPRLNPTRSTRQGKNKPATKHNPKVPTGGTASSYSNGNSFIRLDPKGQVQELQAEIQLAQAKVCWFKHDFKTMHSCSMKALELSQEFGSVEHVAKVCFYVAIARFGLGDFAGGHQSLKNVDKCKGVFREGGLVPWARKEAILFENRAELQRASLRGQKTNIHDSNSPEAHAHSHDDIERNQGKAKMRATVSASPNLAPLANEIRQFDVQGEEAANG